jgi:hypothetical protein
VKDALASWAFGVAFVAAGYLLTLVSPRELVVVAGVGGVLVCACSTLALWREGRGEATAGSLARGGRAARDPRTDEHGSDVVGRRKDGLAMFDHVD